jgi:hypothetical protein
MNLQNIKDYEKEIEENLFRQIEKTKRKIKLIQDYEKEKMNNFFKYCNSPK